MAGYVGPIDMNRGVMYCTVPGHPNFRVFMYLDEPGAYIDGNGNPVPEQTAKRAGFPVEKFRKQALFKSERAKFEAAMRQQLDMTETQEVYAEAEGLQVIHFPDTGNAVIVRDGQRLYPVPVQLSMAMILFEEFVQDAKARAEEVKDAPAADAIGSEQDPSPPPTPQKGSKVGAAALLK